MSAGMDLWPAGREMAWRNRRLLAERLGWPFGAVQECEWAEIEQPGWSPSWMQANDWAERPAGYYAWRYDADHRDPIQYGATAAELLKAIESAPPRYGEINLELWPPLD